MFKFEYLKETIGITVFISNANQTMKLVLKFSIPSGSNWENLKHIELQPNLPVMLITKKESVSLNKNREKYLQNYRLHNNPRLFFEEHCTKIFHLLLYIYASFSLK